MAREYKSAVDVSGVRVPVKHRVDQLVMREAGLSLSS